MAHFTREVKLNENTQVNFNQSREIAYWAKKFNMTQEAFQQIFQDNNFSISKTLAACNANKLPKLFGRASRVACDGAWK